MKKIVLFLCGCLLLTAMTCTKDGADAHHHIKFYNTSNYDIYIERSFDHPDTSLSSIGDITIPGWGNKVEAHSENNEALTDYMDDYEQMFICEFDTLIVFVFTADSLDLYGLDYVKRNYLVSQRYDISLSDLQQLNWQLRFPPTEEMRNIKMWPPYGTYDSLGHLVQ